MKKFTALFIALLLTLFLPLGSANALYDEDYVPEDEGGFSITEYTEDYEYDYGYADDIFTTTEEVYYPISTDLDGFDAEIAAGMFAFIMGYLAFISVLTIVTYIFFALALMKIGQEMGYKNAWFAWVPILNAVMLFQLGGVSPWLLLTAFIPVLGSFVLLIASIVAYMNLSEKRGYEKLLGLLVIVPLGVYILMYLLAWKPKSVVQTEQPPMPPVEEVPAETVQPVEPTQPVPPAQPMQ
jgi:hypothetical protein